MPSSKIWTIHLNIIAMLIVKRIFLKKLDADILLEKLPIKKGKVNIEYIGTIQGIGHILDQQNDLLKYSCLKQVPLYLVLISIILFFRKRTKDNFIFKKKV